MLGMMYFKGKGIEQNYAEAYNCFKDASDRGYAKAAYQIGAMYATGEGMPYSKESALSWFRYATDLGDKNSKVLVENPDLWPFTRMSKSAADNRCIINFQAKSSFKEHYSVKNMPRDEYLIKYLVCHNLHYVDVRDNGGSIWVYAGPGVYNLLKDLESDNFYFEYTKNGSFTTNHKPSYWLPNKYLDSKWTR